MTSDELISAFGEKALNYVNALEEMTKAYAPQVVDAALVVIRVNAAFELISAAVVLVTTFFFVRWYSRNIKRWMGSDSELVSTFSVIGGVFSLGGLAVLSVVSIGVLLSFKYWIALCDPRLYIAYKALGKLL